jgi:DnaJ-domain-containing protein 1
MPYFILGIALLVGALLISRWYVNTPPSALLKMFKWLAIVLAIVIVLFFLIVGPKLWALWALPVLLPWIMRARAAARLAKNWSRMSNNNQKVPPDPEQMSEVETEFLRMYLDHQTGEMNGEVTQGNFAGKTLRNLPLEDLLKLLSEIDADVQSVQVLTAYLNRYHSGEWQQHSNEWETGGNNGESMTVEEAYKILGLEIDASEDSIKEAHHKLMNKNHPDHGGSNFLATKINQAKDLLLGN